MKHYSDALKINEEIGDKRGIALIYSNIGGVYQIQGNYTEALKNNFAALKIREEIGDKEGIALSYFNIGNIYKKQNKGGKASQYTPKWPGKMMKTMMKRWR